ncbi:deoxyribose-phosphate aldolase [Rheinheimera maricola]|uniref:Deoxyribose-phosphate aldolase n=1 Tax=Rheinheimera maricola TaxID=2793282 RepID=A0ABS7XFQ2_9GAMM|nr:deoxyribose-phosphate aldolase [Rheinheimera maricola]MBZ9613557.1 deoxyribose-phosphate aldolase [Rheinheimera maricola]
MTNLQRLNQLASILDITRLQDDDNTPAFQHWLSTLPQLDVAAFCVYPQYLPLLLSWPQPQVNAAIATVVNFPSGDLPTDLVCEQIQQAIYAGATEIDCVLPYKALLRGENGYVKSFLYDVRQVSAGVCLKVIIESGELVTAQQVAKATELVIDGGANFVKSSTGKTAVGITEEAARIMLTVIAASERNVGFKASGGVRTIEQALALLQIFEDVTGRVASRECMRIGASTLAFELAQHLSTDL